MENKDIKEEVKLLSLFVKEGRGTGDGPDDEHKVKEVEHADSK